jgi:hypothetical protein
MTVLTAARCVGMLSTKTADDMREKSRTYRVRLRHAGIKLKPAGRPILGNVASGWRHRMDGTWERRVGVT